MTPEREQEIRDWVGPFEDLKGNARIFGELLEAYDEMRQERDRLYSLVYSNDPEDDDAQRRALP